MLEAQSSVGVVYLNVLYKNVMDIAMVFLEYGLEFQGSRVRLDCDIDYVNILERSVRGLLWPWSPHIVCVTRDKDDAVITNRDIKVRDCDIRATLQVNAVIVRPLD